MEDKENIARLAFRGKAPAVMVDTAVVAFVVGVEGTRTNALGIEAFSPTRREMGRMRSAGTMARGPVKNVAVKVTLNMPVIFTLSVRFRLGRWEREGTHLRLHLSGSVGRRLLFGYCSRST